ncbi:hypothetical protein [Pseudobythopirellula maris]|nr:hypothetical protein [Pseudobythopirellula maris]
MDEGEKLYQQRARIALPLLVRQALAQEQIKYDPLAKEMGMPNPRNLNFVLGSVGATLEKLGARWGERIPPIQSLVVSQGSGLPGAGFFSGFAKLEKPTRQQLEAKLKEYHADIFAYPKWLEVLPALGLSLAETVPSDMIEAARAFRGGPESEHHKALKDLVLNNPRLLGIPVRSKGELEFALPSADRIDVFFTSGRKQFGIEVKSSISGEQDIIRGLFQCVKYQAVLDAWRATEQIVADIRVMLVLDRHLPATLEKLRNTLGVRVEENFSARAKA